MAESLKYVWSVNIKMGRDVPANEKTVDSLMDALSRAVQARTQPKLICHLSRELVKAALISRSLGLWTRDRLDRSIRLLRDSADATLGTPSERNCATRAKDFQEAIARLRDEEKACAPLRIAFAGR